MAVADDDAERRVLVGVDADDGAGDVRGERRRRRWRRHVSSRSARGEEGDEEKGYGGRERGEEARATVVHDGWFARRTPRAGTR